ncbi:extracellular solute-binding protein [Lachnospiraceae bacterium ZAX-1]
MKKRLLAIVLASVMVVGMLSGCGAKSDTSAAKEDGSAKTEEVEGAKEPEATEEPVDEPVEITMLINSNMSLAGVKAACAVIEEKSGIKVEIEALAGGSGDNVVKTRLASGDMADICTYNAGSLLQALNPSEYFIDLSGEEWIDRLDDTFRSTVTFDGNVYGVPTASTQIGAILYNKEIYAKYNLEVPTTWEEFLKNCDILKEAGENAIIGSFGDSWTTQVLYLGDHYNVMKAVPDFAEKFGAGEAKYATSPAGLESFQKLADTQPYYNADYMATTYDDACDMLVNGEGAHWVMLTQALTNIYDLYGDDVNKIGLFGIPGEEDPGLTVFIQGTLLGNKNSDKQDAIKRFMELYISEEALDAYTAAVLPDGPYSIKGYELPDNVYDAIKDAQKYFADGKTVTALEFQTPVKGPNLPAICQEVGSGLITAEEAAKAYDDDCLKQAMQLGLDWK